MHLIDPEVGMIGAAPIVAGTISLALGAALASKIRKDGRISVSFFGDGAAGEGVLYESLNLAALNRLPVLFVCENNLYATHMPILECRISEEISDISKPCDLPSFKIDGNNVLEVYEITQEAVDLCRNKAFPSVGIVCGRIIHCYPAWQPETDRLPIGHTRSLVAFHPGVVPLLGVGAVGIVIASGAKRSPATSGIASSHKPLLAMIANSSSAGTNTLQGDRQ